MINLHKHGKVWGSTQQIFFKNNVEMHRLEAKKGGYCSKHCHEHKYNLFYVESGLLKVTIWKNDYDLIDVTTLNPGDATAIPPGEYHMFEALEDTICYEIYWVDLSESDIVRENHGGTY